MSFKIYFTEHPVNLYSPELHIFHFWVILQHSFSDNSLPTIFSFLCLQFLVVKYKAPELVLWFSKICSSLHLFDFCLYFLRNFLIFLF